MTVGSSEVKFEIMNKYNLIHEVSLFEPNHYDNFQDNEVYFQKVNIYVEN